MNNHQTNNTNNSRNNIFLEPLAEMRCERLADILVELLAAAEPVLSLSLYIYIYIHIYTYTYTYTYTCTYIYI